MKYSRLSETIKPSIFEQLEIRRQNLVSEGREIINLSIGTPDMPPPVHVMEAIKTAAADAANYKYTIVDSSELQSAVINWYKTRYGVLLERDEFTSVYGSQEGIAHISFVVLNTGDTVITGTPGYPIFAFGAKMRDADIYPVLLTEENNYLFDFDAIDVNVAKRAKMIIASYPGNPLTAVANDDFYERLIAFAKRYDIIVVHDNAYSEYIHNGAPGGSFLKYKGAKDVGIEFNSLSKTYNLTGLRISFALGNRDLIKAFKAFRSQIDYGISMIDQKAAIAALTGPQHIIEKNREEYRSRSLALCKGLTDIGWHVTKPSATMFSWLKIPEGRKSEEFALALLDKAGVMLVPGTAFGEGGEGYVRAALVADVNTMGRAVMKIKESGVIYTQGK